jgi:NDP-4-keto-2,6-dideoxyhexose 3-C-methyltransferase
METYRKISACRACGHTQLTQRYDLGDLRLSDFPLPAQRLPSAPLLVLECDACQLAQLSVTVDRDLLFKDQYWYASSINGTMREELRQVVRRARQFVTIHDGDWVLDIGANDGMLLRAWHDHRWEGRPFRIAVEPAQTFRTVLRDAAELILVEPFPSLSLAASYTGKIKAITSIAMFYSVDPLGPFIEEVKRLLAPDGVWVIQLQDLGQMLQQNAVDNICHEHVCYFSLKTLGETLKRHGFFVQHAEQTPINGGSLRVFVRHQDFDAETGEACFDLLAEDLVLNLTSRIAWECFASRVSQCVDHLQQTVAHSHDQGLTVDLLGASTKGNTLLQLAALGPAQIRQAWERHPLKVGRQTITGIPIVAEETGRQDPPDLLVCPIWQFRDALIEREHEYLLRGGKIYFPLPAGELYMGGRE